MPFEMNVTGILLFMVYCVFVNNYIFHRFFGVCPFLGVSGKVETATGMGIAVIFVMGLSSMFTWIVHHALLVPLSLEFLDTIAFILVIASLVQFIEVFMKKAMRALYNALGIYLPLITTNCAVLAVTILNVQADLNYTLAQAVLNGVFSAAGFLLAIVLMAGVRERLEYANVPKCLKGFPISLISAGLMSIAFMGFSGLVK